MKRTLLFFGSMLMALSSGAQNTRKTANRVDNAQSQSDDAILSEGDIAGYDLTEAEELQLTQSNHVPPEPKIREKVTEPGIVIFKNPDGTERVKMDWTTGQHARSLMETLRIGIWRYQAGEANVAGLLGTPQAVEVWPKLRGIYCREYPGGRYIDLHGQIQFCEQGK